MATKFKCKHCGKENEISEALASQIEQEVRADEEEKHLLELERVRKETEERLAGESGLVIKQLQESALEDKKRQRDLQEQILEITRGLRKARQEREDAEIRMQKKLVDEEEKIRQDARGKAFEERDLKDREKDKKLVDALKQVEELKKKMQQGSQQTQGEVLELELEEILKREFPVDKISEVKKGQRGADVAQEVIDKKGRSCGTILWESKNAQWSNGWIGKLKEDQRQAKADLAVLLVSNPPEGLRTFEYRDGVWVAIRKMIIPLALALRFNLVRVNHKKLINVGKKEKMEVLWQYVTSVEFSHRIEAIAEAFGDLQDEMEREKRWFQTKWARQEKSLRKMVDHTQGMYGDLQGVVGKSLPGIKTLQIDSGEE